MTVHARCPEELLVQTLEDLLLLPEMDFEAENLRHGKVIGTVDVAVEKLVSDVMKGLGSAFALTEQVIDVLFALFLVHGYYFRTLSRTALMSSGRRFFASMRYSSGISL